MTSESEPGALHTPLTLICNSSSGTTRCTQSVFDSVLRKDSVLNHSPAGTEKFIAVE